MIVDNWKLINVLTSFGMNFSEINKAICLSHVAYIPAAMLFLSNTKFHSVKIFFDLVNNELSNETIELDKLLSGDIKKIEINENNSNYKLEDLQNMSLKQLRDLAKTSKIKSSGHKTKLELIELLRQL